MTVDSDGSFEFPLVGRVIAGGLSVRQITADLKKRLGPPDGFLVNPQVNIEVETYRSQVVYVNGQVRIPGAVPLKGAMTIMDVLAQAGSPTPEAGPFIEIYRKPAGPASQGPLDPSKASAPRARDDGGSAERAGAADSAARRRHGERAQGADVHRQRLRARRRTPTCSTERSRFRRRSRWPAASPSAARMSRTKIQRMVDGRLVEIKAKMTDLVQPNDTIVVPQRFF